MGVRKEPVQVKTDVPPAIVARAPRRNGNGGGGGSGGQDASSQILEEFLAALQAMRVGDFSARMASDYTGLAGKIADTFNEIVSSNQRMAQQLERVGEVVGRDGVRRTRVPVSGRRAL